MSVDAEEEWAFLRGMDEELSLDQYEDEDFEVEETVTPPLDPTPVRSKIVDKTRNK